MQFNINALLSKLFDDFENHFKMKLLSVADGSFDGIYNARFSGIQKKKLKPANGFNIPSEEIQDNLVEHCIDQGNNLFLVPSRATDGKVYLVDMSHGCCECKVNLSSYIQNCLHGKLPGTCVKII